MLKEEAEQPVPLQHVRGGEREAHQHRTPEEEHGEGHDLLAIAAIASHLPDLINRRLDGQKKAERDHDEDDHAECRRCLCVFRESGQVIRQHR